MTITKSLVEMMGGEISVSSRPDVGSRFTFELSLPLSQAKVGTKQQIDLGGFIALVVDDNDISCGITSKALISWNAWVMAAKSVGEAAQILKIAMAQGKQIPLVITDYDMLGPSGLDFARSLQPLMTKYGMQVLAMTSLENPEIVAGFEKAGVRPF